MMLFHGSYSPEDCIFLLKPVVMAPTDVVAKEKAIQSGARHYSEMLSIEKTPDERYMSLFYRALEQNKAKFAGHLASLARTLSLRPGKEVVLVSLARAGTPVGVLLHRGLKALGRASVHYSISIIRDRGVDAVALEYICRRHSDRDIVFVDGWTGKGAISSELAASVGEFNAEHGTSISSELVVVADLAGVAGLAATSDDYLIPSAILNSIVSGLVSRTILNHDFVGAGDFHACMFYEEKRGEDLSNYFIDLLTPIMLDCLADPLRSPVCIWGPDQRTSLKRCSDRFIADAMHHYGVHDRNRVKPGIGESTRALLRRVPDRLILRQMDAVDVEHLVTLAVSQNVPVEHDTALPYRAAAIIKSIGD